MPKDLTPVTTNQWVRERIWGAPSEEPKKEVTNYEYLTFDVQFCWVTCVPKSDEAALEYFHQLVEWGLSPVYIQVKRPGETKYSLMKYKFDPDTEELTSW
jgi:hypothetical protein